MKYAIRWTNKSSGRSELSEFFYFIDSEFEGPYIQEGDLGVITDTNTAFRARNRLEEYYGVSYTWEVEEI